MLEYQILLLRDPIMGIPPLTPKKYQKAEKWASKMLFRVAGLKANGKPKKIRIPKLSKPKPYRPSISTYTPAASRTYEREAYRRQLALEAEHQLAIERKQEAERVRSEVQMYENRIELLLSVHKECGLELAWDADQSALQPTVPVRLDDREQIARRALETYSWTSPRFAGA